MRQREFTNLLKVLQSREAEIQQAKSADYADVESDVLSNFKEAGDSVGISPLQACWIYIFKHLCAVRAYAQGHTDQTDQLIDRIVDLRVYFALLLALTMDREGS